LHPQETFCLGRRKTPLAKTLGNFHYAPMQSIRITIGCSMPIGFAGTANGLNNNPIASEVGVTGL
jgi:hypothetical protein